MSKLLGVLERFQAKTIKEFRNGCSYATIEHVRDTMLRKEWYNVIWGNTPNCTILSKDMFNFMYVIKSKSYKNQKDAIEHFNKIVKSQLL